MDESKPLIQPRGNVQQNSSQGHNSQQRNEASYIGLAIAKHLAVISTSKKRTEEVSADAAKKAPGNIQTLRSVTKPTSGGKRPQKRKLSLWYALYFPQLMDLPDYEQQQTLTRLAGVAESVSSTVSFHPLALVCEIRSSLNYFAGINPLHEKLEPLLVDELTRQKLPACFLYAASPTVTGSLLLAKSGSNTLVYQKENLRSALGQLSVGVLDLTNEQNRRLHNMGIRQLRDIWRLPTDGIRKRFGSEFINVLNKALGKAPEPTKNYLAPPTFSNSYDLPYELENLDRLIPLLDEMLAQLADFLVRRDLSSSHILISLLHERRGATEVDIALRQPSRAPEHFLLLIETHFTKLTIPSPVIGVKLIVKKFDAFAPHSQGLAIGGKVDTASSHSDLNLFMEQLRARLGDHALKGINHVAEHCPEYASKQSDFSHRKINTYRSKYYYSEVVQTPRPLWLLDEPEQLAVKNGRLYHRQALSLISGPERIETKWWSGKDVKRDYYVARELNGSRLWIFHERHGERHWFLHGYFS